MARKVAVYGICSVMTVQEILRERVAARLAELNLTAREASIDATGKPDLVRTISKGVMPNADNLQRLAATLQTSTEWLLGRNEREITPPGDPRVPTPADLRRLPKNLPILGSALGADRKVIDEHGAAYDVEQIELVASGPIDFMPRPTALSGREGIYALFVAGHSMEPRYDNGRVVLVDGKRVARTGDDVVVQLVRPEGSDEAVTAALLKQLVRQKASGIVVRQFNPPIDFEIQRDQIRSVHPIIPWDTAMGF